MRRINGNLLEICDAAGNAMLTLEEQMQGDMFCIYASGEIRNEAAYELEDEIMAALSVGKSVAIEMSNVTYIASVALHCLSAVQQKAAISENADLVLVNLSPQVQTIFEEAGISDFFNITEA